MPTETLQYATAETQNAFSLAVVNGGASSSQLAQGRSHGVRALEGASGRGLSVTVPANAGPLVAALCNDAGTVPPDVQVTVTQPDGTTINSLAATPANSSSEVILKSSTGALIGMIIPTPQAGLWTIDVTASDASGSFMFYFATIPLASVEQTIADTLPEVLSAPTIGIMIAGSPEAWSGCQWCQFGVWTVAAVLLAAIALGFASLTATTTAVVTTARVLGIAASALLLELGANSFSSTGQLAEWLCGQLGACDSTAARARA